MFYESKNFSFKDLESIAQLTNIPLNILKMLGEDEQRNLKIIYEVERLLSRHTRLILFAPSVDSSNFQTSILRARGHDAFSITSETDQIKRKLFIEKYKNDDPHPKILCNYGVLTTGFDAPKTSAAVIARPTLSLVLYSQMIGLAIRGVKAGGNSEAEVLTGIDRELPGFNSITESFNNWEDVWE